MSLSGQTRRKGEGHKGLRIDLLKGALRRYSAKRRHFGVHAIETRRASTMNFLRPRSAKFNSERDNPAEPPPVGRPDPTL